MTPDPRRLPDQDAQSKHAENLVREQADERWVEISDRVLEKALSVTRRSMTVGAASASGLVNISEQVLIAGIRQALEPVAGAIPTDITVHTDEAQLHRGPHLPHRRLRVAHPPGRRRHPKPHRTRTDQHAGPAYTTHHR